MRFPKSVVFGRAVDYQKGSRKISAGCCLRFLRFEGDTAVRGESRSAAVSPSLRHLSGHAIIEMPQIHPLPLRFPQSAMGKSKKCDFCFCKKLFDGARSPLFIKPNVFGNRAPENRNEVRFLGRGGAECACEHCPKGRCESAADSSDEKV